MKHYHTFSMKYFLPLLLAFLFFPVAVHATSQGKPLYGDPMPAKDSPYGHAKRFLDTLTYRLTVRIKTPEGVKTGSSVWKLYESAYRLTEHTSPALDGDAVSVDLGQRGVLFMLIKGYGPPEDNIGVDYGGVLAPAPKNDVDAKVGTKVWLMENQYPVFVRFKKLKDPATIERVQMQQVLDLWNLYSKGKVNPQHTLSFEKAFGPGVGIESITVEVVNEPVTRGIEKLLPWLASSKDRDAFESTYKN